MDSENRTQSEPQVRSSELVRRLRSHIAMMAPHQKERRTGKLLIEATEIIEMLERVLEKQLFDSSQPSNTELSDGTSKA